MTGAEDAAPRHVGFILDGNRRWAKAQGLPQFEGHRRGYANLRTITRAAAARGVKYISAFVFSTENWQRAQEEVDYLMQMLVTEVLVPKEMAYYIQEGIAIKFLGSRERLSPKLVQSLEAAERDTAGGTKVVVALCFNYGGQLELAEAAARMIEEGTPAAEISVDKLQSYLYHPEIPPIDLVIRTSGEQRLSGFMLWRAAYAELYFTDVHWPAFTETDFDAALADYARRQRRFGK
jgi:undecaprenyl diphosphate synthase